MKSIGFAMTLAGICLLAGTASAENRYAGQGYGGPMRQVSYGYNEIESGGCCGGGPSCGPSCGGCGLCCRPCLIPCLIRKVGRALDCLLPCGRCCAKPCCGPALCARARPALYGGCGGCGSSCGGGGGGCSSCGGGDSYGGDEHYSTPYAPAMKSDPFIDDAPTPAKAKSTKTEGKSRIVRESKTASAERPRLNDDYEPQTRVVASKSKIVGTGVAKVVHEEPVTVKKPVTSLRSIARDDAPAPPALLEEVELPQRSSLPRNPLRK